MTTLPMEDRSATASDEIRFGRAARVVLHVIDPGSPGGGACSLHLLGDLKRAMPLIDHRTMIVGDARHIDLARRCGMTVDGWICPVRNVPFSGARALRRYIQTMKWNGVEVDVIHAWTPRASTLARLASPDVPHLTTLHVGPLDGFGTRYWRRLLARREAPALGATRAIVSDCRRAGLQHSIVSLVPPAVNAAAADLQARDVVRHRWKDSFGTNSSAFVVGLLAEPISWSDVRAAATSVARVLLSGRDVKLVAHAKAMRRIEAERFLNRLGLPELLLIDDAAAEPWQIVGGLDAMLWMGPRRNRPSPSALPLLWAMAAGVPVIAECTDDARQFIDDGVNGYLIDPHDVNAASRQILRLFDDRELGRNLGEAGRAAVNELYGIDAYAMRIQHAYELLLAQGNPRFGTQGRTRVKREVVV